MKVYGSTTYSSKAIQVSVKASVFDSNHCFVLKRSKKAYVWCGTYSTGDQREMAKGFAGKEFDLVLEGEIFEKLNMSILSNLQWDASVLIIAVQN